MLSMPAMAATALDIKPARTDDAALEAYAALLAHVFGASPKFTPQALAWRYRDNPSGSVVGCDAWAGGELAAHYVTTPMAARVDGRPMIGLLSLNTVTHPDFQGRGLFTRLAQATFERGAAEGFGFVAGVANANSTPGFVRKLDFQLIAPLRAGLLARRVSALPPRPLQFVGDWNETRLAWRLANPAARYRVRGARSDGGPTLVRADTDLPLVRCIALLERAPRAPARAWAPPGLDLFLGLDPRLDLSLPGFWPIPARLRPSPLNLIWKALTPKAPQVIDPMRTAFNFLDFDPY